MQKNIFQPFRIENQWHYSIFWEATYQSKPLESRIMSIYTLKAAGTYDCSLEICEYAHRIFSFWYNWTPRSSPQCKGTKMSLHLCIKLFCYWALPSHHQPLLSACLHSYLLAHQWLTEHLEAAAFIASAPSALWVLVTSLCPRNSWPNYFRLKAEQVVASILSFLPAACISLAKLANNIPVLHNRCLNMEFYRIWICTCLQGRHLHFGMEFLLCSQQEEQESKHG